MTVSGQGGQAGVTGWQGHRGTEGRKGMQWISLVARTAAALLLILPCHTTNAFELEGSPLQLSAESVRAVIAQSRDEGGHIVRIRRNLGLFIFDRITGPDEDDVYSSLLVSEFQLVGKVASFIVTENYPYPLSPDVSELVILREINEDRIKNLEEHIPLARRTIDRNRPRLAPASCGFFYEAKPDHADQIQTAYKFVGREVKDIDIGSCIHPQLFRAFGIAELKTRELSSIDRFLSELVALRIVDFCFTEVKQDACLEEQISKIE
jgi:hypothetical protein